MTMVGFGEDDDKYSSGIVIPTRNGKIQKVREVGGTTGQEEDLAPEGMRGMINAIFGRGGVQRVPAGERGNHLRRKATRAQKEAEDTGAVAASSHGENGSNTFLAGPSPPSRPSRPPVAVYSTDIIDSRQIKNLFCPKFFGPREDLLNEITIVAAGIDADNDSSNEDCLSSGSVSRVKTETRAAEVGIQFLFKRRIDLSLIILIAQLAN
ncbi:hypothetical protein K0M31_007745 [Melipona bicolor]|uniref:Uncharacterized protein n=1 Tax=Melipona bicolor TaxID=60889 RepID=A0AA40GBZ8_9HYME|nr:hypothetical protein K0M31_007745 [Melipona bicolor]